MSLFRNPNAGFAYQIVIDGLTQMISSIQILCLLPFAVLLILYLFLKKKMKTKINNRYKLGIILLLFSLFCSFSSFLYFKNRLNKNWDYRVEVSQYGCEVCGVYNYYFIELVFGFNYSENYLENIESVDVETYNKNNIENVNIVDNKPYFVGNSGILEGKNLFVIQAEALANFNLSFVYEDKLLMPYMNEFLHDENVFYFSNMFTSVGLGNTSDAEFCFNTGCYPLGDLTLNWKVYDNNFEIDSLAKMFPNNYKTYSYNPTIEGFYAHNYVHENFYGFDNFSGFETFNSLYLVSEYKEYYLHEKWVSDEAILNFALNDARAALDEGNNFYVFAQTISPHYPFTDVSDWYTKPYERINFKNIGNKFSNYLNQIHYNDKILYDFLLYAKDILPNTLFVIYGDHGNSLMKKEFENLYFIELSDFEYQELLLQIPTIIYDPSGSVNEYLNSMDIDKGYMLYRTLSQIDLFSTVKSLFNLNCEITFGVDMFSMEPSFAINPKSLDIYVDGFSYIVKNNNYYLDGITYDEMIEIVDRIKRFKLASDVWLTLKMERDI